MHSGSGRTGPVHAEIPARGQALMSGAGREDGDIAGRDLDLLATVAAEPHPRMAARNAECLVNGGMVMQIIVDAVAPHLAPAVGAEQSLNGFLRVFVVDVDGTLVDQERHRVVRDQAVVLEDEAERLDIIADNRHGNSPRTIGWAKTLFASCPPIGMLTRAIGWARFAQPTLRYQTDVSGSRSLRKFQNQTGRGGVGEQAALGIGDARFGGGGAAADIQRAA